MSTNIDKTDQRYLQFSLGLENFAMPLIRVREVVGMPETTPIPYAPTYFLGMMNLRGQVISVVDLRKKKGITPKPNNPEQAVVIVDLSPIYLGVVVDSVNKVVALQPDQIEPAPDMEGAKKLEYMLGVFRLEEQLSIVLDIGKLLNVEDLRSIERTEKAA